jgi:organic radical activating enzyme
MKPYSTAQIICTYKCEKQCRGCVNTLHTEMHVPPIGLADLGRFDEIILTGGEPLLYPGKLIDLTDHLSGARLVLYTSAPSYPQLFAVSRFFTGVTITLHDNEDAARFNRYFKKYFGEPDVWTTIPQFFVRIYDAVTVKVELYRTAQYKMCRWVAPEECKLPVNEELFRLRVPWI